jgi:putative transposase
MARPLRIEYEGAYYHVTTRGNERKAIFRDDLDRRKFLELIGRAVEQFDIRVHAYVLMDNHYHLVGRNPPGWIKSSLKISKRRVHPELQPAP